MPEAGPSSLSVTEAESPALRRKVAVALACTVGALGLVPSVAMATESAPSVAVTPVVTKAYESDFAGPNVVPITNKPSGYVMGNAFNGNSMQTTLLSTSGDLVYGEVGSVVCGWLETDTLNSSSISDPNGPCRTLSATIKLRSNIGKDFNCPASGPDACVDGTYSTPLTPECDRKIYRNYALAQLSFSNINFPSGSTGFSDYDRTVSASTIVHYRYRTLDDKAIWVRIDGIGWAAMGSNCVEGTPTGGPLESDSTTAGANPNAVSPLSTAESIAQLIQAGGLAKPSDKVPSTI